VVRARGGKPAGKHDGPLRCWAVPCGAGTLDVEVTLRSRYGAIAVDRRGTRPPTAQQWFSEHVRPAVQEALSAGLNGWAATPTGTRELAQALPIRREELLGLLSAWIDEELKWGQGAS
jgi:hypothetical protein